ncbi:MAG: alpha/beta hydrolase [Candidatus Pacebacteria bacterium]|nr:alpha/beta hydrolase [Candidatus Paceibacterota bacterium]
MVTKLRAWIEDYIHAANFYSKSFIYREPPEHYLGHISDTKVPIILVPGLNTKWQFLKLIADRISILGHPIYVVSSLGYNRKEIQESAKLVRALIDEKNLKNVIILSHSKGGLIGKEVLIRLNEDKKILKVIAIATPFLGSGITKFSLDKSVKELAPKSEIIQEHNKNFDVNKDIISIYGMYDNHVWPTEHSILEGAENIQVDIDGHHKILAKPKARELIVKKIEEITQNIEHKN